MISSTINSELVGDCLFSCGYQHPNQSYVDMFFGVTGQKLDRDHGYELYAALSHCNPLLHCGEGISIHSINGLPGHSNTICLTERSHLRLRLPIYQIRNFYSLAGKELSIGNCKIILSTPQIYPLKPASVLYASLVVIRGYREPESFLEAAYRQLQKLDVKGEINFLVNQNGKPSRRTIQIKQFTLVGFGLKIAGLSKQDSLQLQMRGIGGKQKMGCGIFVR